MAAAIDDWKKLKAKYKVLADGRKFRPDVTPLLERMKVSADRSMNRFGDEETEADAFVSGYRTAIARFDKATNAVRQEWDDLTSDWVQKDADFAARIKRAIDESEDGPGRLYEQFEKGWSEYLRLRKAIDAKFYALQAERLKAVSKLFAAHAQKAKAIDAAGKSGEAEYNRLVEAARKIVLDYEKTALEQSDDALAKDLRTFRARLIPI